MTVERPVDLRRRWRRYALIAGVLVALVCKALPPKYQDLCHAVARLCTGGIQ